MRFVHVDDVMLPDAGYQINMLTKLQVEQGHEVIVVTAELDKFPPQLTAFFGKDNIAEKDKRFEENTGVKIVRHPLYAYYSGRAIYKPGLQKVIKSLNADVLFIHCEDTYVGMKLIWAYDKMKIPYVLDCHMLEMASENRFREYFRMFFRKFVTPIILKNKIPLIRIVDSDFVEKHYGIPLDRTKLLSFGTDTEFYKPNSSTRSEFRDELGFSENDFVVIYAGKMDHSKGGQFLAETLREKFILEGKNIKFIIIGNPPGDEYGEEVTKILSRSENKIIRFPTQTYADLARFYQMADIAIFPKQCSMSYFEVQSCGLPVVLEKNEINVERAAGKKGIIFSEGSVEEFRNAILKFGNMPNEEFVQYKNNARQNVVDNYNFIPIAQQFTDVMIQAYKDFHKKKNNEN